MVIFSPLEAIVQQQQRVQRMCCSVLRKTQPRGAEEHQTLGRRERVNFESCKYTILYDLKMLWVNY